MTHNMQVYVHVCMYDVCVYVWHMREPLCDAQHAGICACKYVCMYVWHMM